MAQAAKELRFEEAAHLRDQIVQLRKRTDENFEADLLRAELKERRRPRKRTQNPLR